MFQVVSSPDVKRLILDLNKFNQLFEGLDADGRELDGIGGSYSFTTIRKKLSKGLPIDRVTLFDEGDFYDTFRLDVSDVGFIISADTFKEGVDLQDRWGFDLVGLTDESFEQLQDEIKQRLILWLLDFLLD